MSAGSAFITIEGADGCGKTTLARGLSAALEAAGHDVLLTREPGGTAGAEAIRELLLGPPGDGQWSQWAQAMLFSAARRDHVEKSIAPAVDGGKWVICDRFMDSMHVYQWEVEDSVRAVLETGAVGGYRPDLTFVLDMPGRRADVLARQSDLFAQAGCGASGSMTADRDAIERSTAHGAERLRRGFLALAKSDRSRFCVLDARDGADEVLRKAMQVVGERFGVLLGEVE